MIRKPTTTTVVVAAAATTTIKDPGNIFYTIRAIANFVPSSVAMATKFGQGEVDW